MSVTMMRPARRGFLSTLVVGAVVALLGGLQVSVAGAQVPSQAAWEVVGDLDSPSATGRVVALSGGRALLTGVDGGDLRHVDLFDPSTGIKRVADAPASLNSHFAASLLNGRVLVGAGLRSQCDCPDLLTRATSQVAVSSTTQ
jgi:hypothetical protein